MTDGKCDVLQHAPADVWVVKEREIGNADQQVHCRTHLSHLLTPGDVVLGSVQLVFLKSFLAQYCMMILLPVALGVVVF